MLELCSYIYATNYDEQKRWLTNQRNGLLHGIEINYYADDDVKSLECWRNGKRHGINIHFCLDGTAYVQYRHNDKLYDIKWFD